jgi:hypothetical protein
VVEKKGDGYLTTMQRVRVLSCNQGKSQEKGIRFSRDQEVQVEIMASIKFLPRTNGKPVPVADPSLSVFRLHICCSTGREPRT